MQSVQLLSSVHAGVQGAVLEAVKSLLTLPLSLSLRDWAPSPTHAPHKDHAFISRLLSALDTLASCLTPEHLSCDQLNARLLEKGGTVGCKVDLVDSECQRLFMSVHVFVCCL